MDKAVNEEEKLWWHLLGVHMSLNDITCSRNHGRTLCVSTLFLCNVYHVLATGPALKLSPESKSIELFS